MNMMFSWIGEQQWELEIKFWMKSTFFLSLGWLGGMQNDMTQSLTSWSHYTCQEGWEANFCGAALSDRWNVRVAAMMSFHLSPMAECYPL